MMSPLPLRECVCGWVFFDCADMSDIRHALLRRDPLSAAKEVLYHLDIALGSTLQNGPGLDKNTVDLVEEFIFHVPKDRNTQRKVRRGRNPDVS